MRLAASLAGKGTPAPESVLLPEAPVTAPAPEAPGKPDAFPFESNGFNADSLSSLPRRYCSFVCAISWLPLGIIQSMRSSEGRRPALICISRNVSSSLCSAFSF